MSIQRWRRLVAHNDFISFLDYNSSPIAQHVNIMSDTENLVREKNKQLVLEFEAYLKQSGLSSKTIKNQVLALDFFTEYLVYYEPYTELSEIDTSDVNDFLSDFFPEKASWASETSVKEYITVFKKYFKWMVSTKRMQEDDYLMLLDEIKQSKEEWLSLVDYL